MRECNSWMRDAFDYILLEKSSSALFWTVMTWGSRGWSWLSCWWGSSCPSSPPLGCNSQERTVFPRQLRADQAFPAIKKGNSCKWWEHSDRWKLSNDEKHQNNNQKASCSVHIPLCSYYIYGFVGLNFFLVLKISSQPAEHWQNDQVVQHLPPTPHLVHGMDKAASKHSQDYTGEQLQQEAVEPHVQAEQQVTPFKVFKL